MRVNRGVPTAPIAVSPDSLALTGCQVGATQRLRRVTEGFFPNNGASNAFVSTFPNTNQSDNGIGKIDYHLNDKNTINGLLAISKYTGIGEDHPYVNATMLNTFPITVWTTTENWIYTPTSSVVNEVRFGYNRMTIAQDSLDAGLRVSGKYGLNGRPAGRISRSRALTASEPSITGRKFQDPTRIPIIRKTFRT